MRFVNDPIFGSQYIPDKPSSRLMSCRWAERSGETYQCTQKRVDEWSIELCCTCDLWERRYEDVYRKLQDQRFVLVNVLGLSILLIGVLITIQISLGHLTTPWTLIRKTTGVLSSIFGILLMSQRFTLHARAKIKAAIPALTSRIRKSVLFETAYYSSEGIRAVIAILIVLILGAVVYGSVGDYLMIRFKWYVYVRLFFAIPILGVFLFGLIAEPIFKLLGIFFDYLLERVVTR